MNIALRIINTLLLAGILAILTLIFLRMPPTIGELENARRETDRQAILLRKPIIDAAVQEPLRVEISPP
jgi:hypothetical protein